MSVPRCRPRRQRLASDRWPSAGSSTMRSTISPACRVMSKCFIWSASASQNKRRNASSGKASKRTTRKPERHLSATPMARQMPRREIRSRSKRSIRAHFFTQTVLPPVGNGHQSGWQSSQPEGGRELSRCTPSSHLGGTMARIAHTSDSTKNGLRASLCCASAKTAP